MVTPAMRTTAVLLGFLNLRIPEMVTPAMRTTAVLLGLSTEDNSSFARFFKLERW